MVSNFLFSSLVAAHTGREALTLYQSQDPRFKQGTYVKDRTH